MTKKLFDATWKSLRPKRRPSSGAPGFTSAGAMACSISMWFVTQHTSLRPVVWSKASIIYKAHSSQPLVEGSYFPSKRLFTVPQPSVIQTALYNHLPPTILSISPCDRWLFAFFPGEGVPGVACLWTRGDEIDVWTEKEWWHFDRKNEPITAEWLGGPREASRLTFLQSFNITQYLQWVTDPSGTPRRLPPRGPTLPSTEPALLLVTQACRVTLCCYLRQIHSVLVFKTYHSSLLEPDEVQDKSASDLDPFSDLLPFAGTETAVAAAIGFHYGGKQVVQLHRGALRS